jgi:hypothetical protein
MFVQQYPKHAYEDKAFRRPKTSPVKEVAGHSLRYSRGQSTSSSDLKDHHTKRTSIFSKRPKSILATASHESLTRWNASVGSPANESRRSFVTDTESPKSLSLFGRRRKSRSSSVRPYRASSPVDADDESDSRRERLDRAIGIPGKGVRISAPFGFQHMGKVEEQAAPIDEDTAEMFENFRTLRKGHRKAVIAPSPDQEEYPATVVKRHNRPPPLRPRRPDEPWGDYPGSAPLPHHQEYFQISSHHFTQPKSADPTNQRAILLGGHSPPRSAPIFAHDFNSDHGPGPVLDTETGMHRLESPDEYQPFVPLYDAQPPGWIETSVPLLHTVSPIDPFPEYPRAPILGKPLEKVLEEPEGTFSSGHSIDLPRRPSLRHSKSSPAIATRYKASTDAFAFSVEEHPLPPLARRLERPLSQCSQGSDTLGNSFHPLRHETTKVMKMEIEPRSPPLQQGEATWEEDIDYLYENNAEADCEFNWQDITHFDDNDSDEPQSWSGQHSSYGSSIRLNRKDIRVPSNSSVPELDYRYSHAASTASLSIATPRDGSLYRASDALPPLPDNIEAIKDLADAHDSNSELQPAAEHLCNEIMVARNVNSIMTRIPSNAEERSQTVLYTGLNPESHYHVAAPTLQLSRKHVPTFPEPTFEHENNPMTRAINAARMPVPGNPAPSYIDGNDVPQLVPRNYIGVQNAAKLRLFDAQSRLSNLAPTSMPRGMSSDSVDTGIQYTDLPTPPKTPSSAEMTNTRSFLATPSPSLPPVPSPMSRGPRYPSPINTSHSLSSLPQLEQTRSASPRLSPSSSPRYRAESAAARLGVLPSPPASYLEKSGTPDSTPAGISGCYSLFPSRTSTVPLDSRAPLTRASTTTPSMATAPISTTPIPTPPMPAIPTPTSGWLDSRPSSRAASETSSQTSSRPSSRAPSSQTSSKTKSKRRERYRERYPLGI